MTFVEQIHLYLEGKLGGVVDFVLKALLALIIYFIARKLIQEIMYNNQEEHAEIPCG